jgi:hypothetical protein
MGEGQAHRCSEHDFLRSCLPSKAAVGSDITAFFTCDRCPKQVGPEQLLWPKHQQNNSAMAAFCCRGKACSPRAEVVVAGCSATGDARAAGSERCCSARCGKAH